MKQTPVYYFLILLVVLQTCLLSCHSPKSLPEYWLQVGLPLGQWRQVKQSSLSNTDSTLFTSQSVWECIISDTALSNFEKVCWMAPDSLQFEFLLNGESLVFNHGWYLWPSSFSNDEVHIYSNNWELRPFVIDANKLRALLKPTGNNLRLKIVKNTKGDKGVGDCAFYIAKRGYGESQLAIESQKRYTKGKLPCVFILSKDYLIPNNKKTNAQFQMVCGNSNRCDEITSEIKLEVRGFSSSNFPKKQYSLFFVNDSLKKEKVSLLGMSESKRWILQGPYSDPSLIRNAMVYDTWRKMGYWSTHTRFVELIMNGTYQGVYLLMERVEASKARLDIASADTIKEPFLVQLNRADNNDTVVVAGDYKFILYKTPRKKESDIQYRNDVNQSMTNWMNHMEHPLISNEVDWNSFADFILIQELFKNVDAYYVSLYIHGDGKRIVAGPVWDFDLSMGASSILGGQRSDGWVYENNKKSIPVFWKWLVNDEAFQALMKERYLHFRTNTWSGQTLSQAMDSLVMCIGEDAVERNFQRFPIWGNKQLHTYHNVPESHPQEISKMKQWLEKRLIWMDEQFK